MLRRQMRWTKLIVLLVTGALAGGCGSSAEMSPDQSASLVLDFTPNAIHAGIYSALARTFDDGEGIRLRVIAPSASTDSIKLLASGRVNFAILDIHDLAIARERGERIVGIMAIVERPLAAVIAAPGIRSPRQLVGKTVGVSGLPSDTAVLRSILSGAGGNPRQVNTVTIGFNAVAALLSGRVSAVTAFWNDEGVTLRRRHPGFHVFRVDAYGAPSYPELVLCTTSSTIEHDPQLVHSVVRTLVRGYGVTLTDPAGSEADLESRVRGLDPALVSAELNAVEPAFLGPHGQFGELDLRTLRAWARWERRFGIVSKPPDVGAMFDPQFLAGTSSLIGS
jgi:NitT/TauT family transport system substrate-binding protein/putative hydroxymethylpyrimidine transport system substrate-binding protein